MYPIRFHPPHLLISVIGNLISEDRATFDAPGTLNRRWCRVSMPDPFHSQTHKDQLSRVEGLETKVKQADEV
jgi:hypothetical protein